MRATANKKLNLLDAEDFVNREVLNENTEKIDEVLKTLEEPEHDTTKQAEVEELASGESLKVALRKLAKAVADYISHKADKVAHITAEERTAWNAKLGVEKIAANLTTDTDGMVLAAAMGKNLKEQIDTNANAISTLNSNISPMSFKKVKNFVLNSNGGTCTISNLIGQYILTSNQGAAIGDAAGMSFITITTNSAGCIAFTLCGGERYKQINVSVTAGSLILTNPNNCDIYMNLYKI